MQRKQWCLKQLKHVHAHEASGVLSHASKLMDKIFSNFCIHTGVTTSIYHQQLHVVYNLRSYI